MRVPPPELVDRLLEQTEAVLTDDAVRLEDVARTVGTSRARLYYYFAGQDDLRAFLVQRHLEEGAAVLADATDPSNPAPDRLRAVVVAAATFLAGRPGVCAGMLGGAGSSGALGGTLEATDEVIAAPLRALVADGVRDGSLHAPDPAAAADAVLGAVLLAVLGRWQRGDDGDAARFAAALADQVVAGLAVD